MRKAITLAATLALLLVPAFAAVAAPAAGGEAGGVNPFAGDVGNAIWTLLIFVLLLVVLGKFAWTPILDGLQGREAFIRESLEEAKRNRDESEARLQEYETKIAGARQEVDEMIAEAKRDAVALRQREEAAAKEEATMMLERAKREIQIAKDTAVRDLYDRAAGLSVAAASRILDREITPADHERLIAESIASLESRPN